MHYTGSGGSAKVPATAHRAPGSPLWGGGRDCCRTGLTPAGPSMTACNASTFTLTTFTLSTVHSGSVVYAYNWCYSCSEMQLMVYSCGSVIIAQLLFLLWDIVNLVLWVLTTATARCSAATPIFCTSPSLFGSGHPPRSPCHHCLRPAASRAAAASSCSFPVAVKSPTITMDDNRLSFERSRQKVC